jgi:hypothetical protein
MPKQRLNLLFSRKPGILVTVTVGVNHEASPAKLVDKLSTRIGVMTRIVVYSRINVAKAGHLLLDFLLKGRSNNNRSRRNTCALDADLLRVRQNRCEP